MTYIVRLEKKRRPFQQYVAETNFRPHRKERYLGFTPLPPAPPKKNTRHTHTRHKERTGNFEGLFMVLLYAHSSQYTSVVKTPPALFGGSNSLIIDEGHGHLAKESAHVGAARPLRRGRSVPVAIRLRRIRSPSRGELKNKNDTDIAQPIAPKEGHHQGGRGGRHSVFPPPVGGLLWRMNKEPARHQLTALQVELLVRGVCGRHFPSQRIWQAWFLAFFANMGSDVLSRSWLSYKPRDNKTLPHH